MTRITLKDGTTIVDKSDLLTICAYITENSNRNIDTISTITFDNNIKKVKINEIKSIETI